MANSGFLAGIEGLRALAVLAVLLFHLDLSGFTGGYLGVDLFFVISGFIITRNILLEQGRGTFTLKDFYLRRFRRLFPALAVTVLVTLLAALPLLPPRELALLGESAIFALFSLANINFWLEAGYFDAAAHTKPLLHTWSLSVEEQFYLFWPALLVFLAATRRAPVAALLLLGSLLGAYFWRVEQADAVFYLLPFRVHQLMVGALVAMLALRLPGAWGNAAVAVGSAGFVGLISVLADAFTPATGAIAVSALGLLLLLGRESGLALAVYGLPLMQWIGRRSYALYLVHWPLVVLYLYARGFEELAVLELMLLFAAFFVLAAALHSAVEHPFRLRSGEAFGANRRAMPVTLGVLVVSCALAGAFWLTDGRLTRSGGGHQSLVDSVEAEKAERLIAIRNGRCNLQPQHDFTDYAVDECATPVADRPNVLVIGDSRAADMYVLLSRAFPELHILQATGAACSGLIGHIEDRESTEACRELNAFRFGALLEHDLSAVVLASTGTAWELPYLRETARYLADRGLNTILFGPRGSWPAALPLMVAQARETGDLNAALGPRMRQKRPLFDLVRRSAPQATVIDMLELQCAPTCDAVLEDRLLYYDAFHFTVWGAEIFGRRLREQVDFLALVQAATD